MARARRRLFNAYAPESKLEGGIRLAISERDYYRPPSFSMSKKSYLRIEKHLHLSQATLHALANEGGMVCRFLEYDDSEPRNLKRIGIIIKAAQKYQIGNYGLFLSHELATGFTTGLLHGTGVMLNRNDFPVWPESPSVEIFDLIKSVPSLWTKPMLLPTILLQHHFYRAESFCTIQLEDRVSNVQHQLGMSRAGRLYRNGPYKNPVGKRPIKDIKVNFHNLTGEMNTCITETVWFCRLSNWQCDCIDFLARILDEVAGPIGAQADSSSQETREIRECIEYLASAARGLKEHNNHSKERMQADFNVLCSLVAQIDNRLTAKMAASSSRDSTAMKTLAFITTLYLPGTFVATIFSTGMFNWQSLASGVSSPRLVSSYFWIYWAFTIPLTITVALSWRIWWAWEKQHLDQDVLLEIENIEESTSINLRNEKLASKEQIMSSESILSRGWKSLRRRSGKQISTDKDM